MEKTLRAVDISALRTQAGKAAGLFITDRCPVGCAHCSVDSRKTSPTISDFALFEEMVSGLASQQMLEIVALTGGEPLIERRGIETAVRILKHAKKRLVLFTSGIWAKRSVASWIKGVLDQIDTVFLSTDRYHEDKVNQDIFVTAAASIAESGCWIVVQTLDQERDIQRARHLLTLALGSSYADHSEIVVSKPLPYGRGEELFDQQKGQKIGQQFGACALLGSPLIRYDGRVTACCNEKVIMGHGSARLAKKCATSTDLAEALTLFRTDPFFQVVSSLGFETLLIHPRFSELSSAHFPDICHICWAANDAMIGSINPEDALLRAMAMLGSQDTDSSCLKKTT
jgi:organic radical activating enzyme